MTDPEKQLLADYCRKVHYNMTLKQLIEEHQKLAAERVEIEKARSEFWDKGFHDGYKYGVQKTLIDNGIDPGAQ